VFILGIVLFLGVVGIYSFDPDVQTTTYFTGEYGQGYLPPYLFFSRYSSFGSSYILSYRGEFTRKPSLELSKITTGN
jgi:hypothetical protein